MGIVSHDIIEKMESFYLESDFTIALRLKLINSEVSTGNIYSLEA